MRSIGMRHFQPSNYCRYKVRNLCRYPRNSQGSALCAKLNLLGVIPSFPSPFIRISAVSMHHRSIEYISRQALQNCTFHEKCCQSSLPHPAAASYGAGFRGFEYLLAPLQRAASLLAECEFWCDSSAAGRNEGTKLGFHSHIGRRWQSPFFAPSRSSGFDNTYSYLLKLPWFICCCIAWSNNYH